MLTQYLFTLQCANEILNVSISIEKCNSEPFRVFSQSLMQRGLEITKSLFGCINLVILQAQNTFYKKSFNQPMATTAWDFSKNNLIKALKKHSVILTPYGSCPCPRGSSSAQFKIRQHRGKNHIMCFYCSDGALLIYPLDKPNTKYKQWLIWPNMNCTCTFLNCW